MTLEPESPEPAAAAAAAPDLEVEVDPLAERIHSLEAQLELSQEKARETFAQLKEEHELRLRAAADLENQRRRAQREQEETRKFGGERLLKELVPVVDNLDRALAAAAEEDPLAKGVRLVRKALEDVLARNGVEMFSALGKPFDPRMHEALAHLESEGAEPGSVVAEHGRGFLLHGRLLRPALVAVAPPRGEVEVQVEPAEPDTGSEN